MHGPLAGFALSECFIVAWVTCPIVVACKYNVAVCIIVNCDVVTIYVSMIGKYKYDNQIGL